MKISSSIIIPELGKSISGRLELRWLQRWAQRVMILNEGVRQQAMAQGFSPRQLVWMPNPVDTDEFSPATATARLSLRSRLNIPSISPVILYSGRLASVKALPSLLDAFAVVVRHVPEAMLILVGDGPLRTALEQQIKYLHLNEQNVRFTGLLDQAEVCSWLKIADIFTLVSHSEGFSCALTEAMSAGLACVVSDIPANRQLINDGEHGLVAPVGNSESIAEAILRLINNLTLRMCVGQAARRRILENYSTSKIADRYEAIFREIVDPLKNEPKSGA